MKKYICLITFSIFVSNCVFAQNEKSKSFYVSGVVTDSLNNPFKGVNVIIKNSRIGTVVDDNGKYKIDITKFYQKKERIIVVFSFIGFKSIEKEIDISDIEKNKNQTINLILKEEANPISCNG